MAAPPGYTIVDVARDCPKYENTINHGGIVLFCRSIFRIKRVTITFLPTTFELLLCSVHSAASVTIFAIIYRPGSQPLSVKFFDELMSLFEIILLYKSCLVIAGDLNIHFDDPDDCHGKHFCELLELLGLSQHVFQSTHVRGHTLDLIITREDSRVHDICVDPRFTLIIVLLLASCHQYRNQSVILA